MNVITIILGIRFARLMRLVFRNGLGLRPVYLLRFLMLMQASLVSSLLTLAEKAKYGRAIRRQVIERDPVFIIGHWRTGSTFLHQLLDRDPGFTTPKMVQTVIPDHFLFSTKYYVPILRKMVPPTRSMDRVRLTPFEPQEEEFALVRMGCESPIESLLFPERKGYFLTGYQGYIPSGRKLEKWKSSLLDFYRKLTLGSDRQIVSKNPYHTMRLPLLMEMFPDARFIHIHRDPLEVVPSTIHMWDTIARENKLKGGWEKPSAGEVASVLKEFLSFIESEKQKLSPGHFTELGFADLESDPVNEIQRIYKELNLEFTPEFHTRLSAYLEENRSYKKNHYTLSADDRTEISSIMSSG